MATIVHHLITWLLVLMAGISASDATELTDAKPGCSPQCGGLKIPYPFGIGSGCSLNPFYSIICNTTNNNPPKAFLINPNATDVPETTRTDHEIISFISNQIRIRNAVIYECAGANRTKPKEQGMLLPPDSPFVFSSKANMIMTVGCEFYTNATRHDHEKMDLCSSRCSEQDVKPGPCNGTTGCQNNAINIADLREFYLDVVRANAATIPYDRCGYGFIGLKDEFRFQGASDFDQPELVVKRILETVPLVVDWVIGNQTCKEAQKNVCQDNAHCTDADSGLGYVCACNDWYKGNPYLPKGCVAHCPFGSACYLKSNKDYLIGLGITSLSLTIGICWMWITVRKRRSIRRKEELFAKNGGLLLQGQLSSMSQGGSEPIKIFTERDLQLATNNFSDGCIAGRGGFGIVYRGVLEDKGVIAIKRAILVDDDQIEQFINELVILSQVNHRNVVKLLGCCLEVEVPLLVYDFVPNGALFNHIHNGDYACWLDWPRFLRIISEIANALSYLHCSANSPIIHRDIKSANILVDDNYTAKISDFGASRLVPLDQTRLNTGVQGTLGYLDPEYLFTSELTEKSDVYSFGVLVAEIMTRKKAVFLIRESQFKNLATYFVESIWKGKVASIVDRRLVENVPFEELMFVAEIVGQCLREKRENRPSMKDIAAELDKLANPVIADDKSYI